MRNLKRYLHPLFDITTSHFVEKWPNTVEEVAKTGVVFRRIMPSIL